MSRFLSGALGAICAWCRAVFNLAQYSLAMVPKKKAMELRMVMHHSMEGVHARNVETLVQARAALNEAQVGYAGAAEAKNGVMAEILMARQDLLRAREIQERYLGSRIESTNPGGFSLGIKYVDGLHHVPRGDRGGGLECRVLEGVGEGKRLLRVLEGVGDGGGLLKVLGIEVGSGDRAHACVWGGGDPQNIGCAYV
jgi:hypothetical protein